MSLQNDPEAALAPPSNLETAQEPRSNLPPDLADLTDEQISVLTQEITDSYTKDVPLVGPFLPISVLLEEFKDNEPFKRKISGLAEKWSGFRRTARNGNCFYQAFTFAWLDHLQRLGDKRILQEIHKVQKTAKTLDDAGIYVCNVFELMVGFEKLAYEDFLEATVTLLESLPLTKAPSLAETLKYIPLKSKANKSNQEVSSPVIVYLRFLSSTHLRLNEDLYGPFLEPPYYDNVRLYCAQCIEAFGREADNVGILALARAIQVGIDVSYLDRSAGEEPIVYEFRPDEWREGDEKVELLYRPGHYDILCNDGD